MAKKILVISDIHGNYPALQAVARTCDGTRFDYIINAGDSLVYAPFPNETLRWLIKHEVISILGNTDRKVIKLIRGKSFKKPGKEEKRIMYTTTAAELSDNNRRYLLSLNKKAALEISPGRKTKAGHKIRLGVFHGSPADHDEFLFAESPLQRFRELARITDCNIVITGHSHSPYHREVAGVHFINSGSVGRMFDGDPRASFATLTLRKSTIAVKHHRVDYDIGDVVKKIRACGLPELYIDMFQLGQKLN